MTVFIARVHVGNGVVAAVVSKQQFVGSLLFVFWLIKATTDAISLLFVRTQFGPLIYFFMQCSRKLKT